MPDITLCKNKECPSKDDCYRFTATPSQLQSWAIFQCIGVRCELYIPNERYVLKNNTTKGKL